MREILRQTNDSTKPNGAVSVTLDTRVSSNTISLLIFVLTVYDRYQVRMQTSSPDERTLHGGTAGVCCRLP